MPLALGKEKARAIVAAADANALDALAAEIRREHEATEAAFETAIQRALRVGDLLIIAKERVRSQLGPRQWEKWVGRRSNDGNVPFTVRTARNYMRLARNRKRVADFKKVREAIDAVTDRRAMPHAMNGDDAAARVSDVPEAVEGADRATLSRLRRDADRRAVPPEVIAESRGYTEALTDALELVHEAECGLRGLTELREDIEGLRNDHRAWLERAGVTFEMTLERLA